MVQESTTSTEGRGLLTDAERAALAGERSDSYRYKTRSYLKRRIERVERDADVLADHAPDLLDDLRAAVDAAGESDDTDGERTPRTAGATDATETTAGDRNAESGHTRDESDGQIGAILDGWEPDTETDASTARAQTRRAVEWLREDGGRRTKSDFVDALAGDTALGERTWWERAVQPGLRRFRDADLVEYREGHHDYRWIGEGGRGL